MNTQTNSQTTVKTIDVHAKEWFDRVNGNSYFSARATVNYGMAGEKTVILPFQYGYGNHYVDMAAKELEKEGYLPNREHHSNGSSEALWRYCEKNNIILRYDKQEKCLKREVVQYGTKD